MSLFRCWRLSAASVIVFSGTASAGLLYDNGPIVTNPTGGTGAILGKPISQSDGFTVPGSSFIFSTTGVGASVALGTAAADDFATVELYKISLPAASGSALTAAAVTTAIDSAHDAAAERKAAGDHLMTVTLASPAWVDDGDVYALKLTVDAAAGTVFTLYGARALYELRA